MDCVLPTRAARHACLYTSEGRVLIKNARYAQDQRPPDPNCSCSVCRRYTRAYLRHLFAAGELTASILATHHNVHFYLDLLRQIREAIGFGNLANFSSEMHTRYAEGPAWTLAGIGTRDSVEILHAVLANNGTDLRGKRAENPVGCEDGKAEPAGLIPSPRGACRAETKGMMQSLTMIGAILFQGGGATSFLANPLFMMVIVMGIFYVMLILPQQRQRKKTQAMLAALKNGDKIITNSGIYGVVNGIDGETVILKIADQVKIRIARSAIAQVEASEDAK
jgi:preprotein translocase YajC subunit